jgi:hypothetical protein
MYIGLDVQCPLSYQILKKLDFLDRFSKKYSNTKCHGHLSSGSSFHVDGKTDMTKLTVVFYNFANTPQNWQ